MSNIIRHGRPPGNRRPDLLAQLMDPARQRAFCERLGVPHGVFGACDEADVIRRVGAAGHGSLSRLRSGMAAGVSGSDWITEPRALGARGVTLHEVEQTQVGRLVQTVVSGGRRILYWHSDGPIGAGMMAYEAAALLANSTEHGVGRTFAVRPSRGFATRYIGHQDRPSDRAEAFDEGIRDVARALGVKDLHGPKLPRELLEKLIGSNAVLFVLNVGLLPDEPPSGNLLVRLLKEASSHSAPLRRKGEPVPICLVGDLPEKYRRRYLPRRPEQPEIDIMKDMEAAARRHYGENTDEETVRQAMARTRISLFATEWERYCKWRGIRKDDWLGPRLRTAEWFYERIDEPLVWPHSIRVRAWLASNYGTASYFDPTLGWTRLAGMEAQDLPPEIQLILDEMVSYAWAFTSLNHAERVLRWVSTSLYWMTETMVEHLKGKFTGVFSGKSTFESGVERMPALVHRGTDGFAGSSAYRGSLGVRAIMQDRWMRESPDIRRRTHYHIAERLWSERHNPYALAREFPLGPDYGQSHPVILAETIRHLMRSTEGLVAPFATEDDRQFPEKFPPGPHMDGFRLADIVNFCFGTIFWKEMNGNSSRHEHMHRRRLGKQHGLYHLTAELLEILSADGRLGRPHPSLHPNFVLRYYRELALALLDIGELDGAQCAIEDHLREAEKNRGMLFKLNAKLDLVIILTTRDRLVEAAAVLAGVEEDFGSLRKPQDGKHLDAQQKNYKGRYELLEHRLRGRKAHLLYLQGRHAEVLDLYAGMQEDDKLKRDLAHPYIAALGAMGGENNLLRAQGAAARAAFLSDQENYRHERLGHRIAAAHAQRKFGTLLASHRDAELGAQIVQQAEDEMSYIYEVILSEGCSERTYQSFLIEAGRILLAQGRYARAYAVYLRPCLDRTESRGYMRAARTALRHSAAALAAIPGELASCTDRDAVDRLKRRIMAGDKTMSKGINKYEPKYAFRRQEPGHWPTQPNEEAALHEQRRQLDAIRDRICPVAGPGGRDADGNRMEVCPSGRLHAVGGCVLDASACATP